MSYCVFYCLPNGFAIIKFALTLFVLMNISLKFRVTRYSVVEIQKHNMDFSVNFYYYCLLLTILLYKYTNTDFQICRYNRLNIKDTPKASHWNNF